MLDFIIKNLGKLVLGVVLLVGLIYGTKNYAKIKKFFQEVKIEINKVSWPTRQELLSSSWLVIILTFIMSIFLGIIDLSLSKILSLILKS
ncbi:MAG: preprotein translocase subunit SecE [Candidatus Omnitrophica bacterium]|nr:preprotein translocase subunit SecE [Candidatus Omnitrophota bacterium]